MEYHNQFATDNKQIKLKLLEYWVNETYSLLYAFVCFCSVTGDAVRFVTSFIYDFTSRHYNYSLQCALFISVLILYLGWSSDLLWSASLVAPLICFLLSKSTLLSRSSPDWYENTLFKGCLLSSIQRWIVLLRNPTIRSLFVVAGNAIWAAA
jgi:hypothetical protein